MEETTKTESRSVMQDWVLELSFMAQSALMTTIRGADGIPKNHVSKVLLRWFRRCVFYSALDHRVLSTPYEKGGGSFTGPCRYPTPETASIDVAFDDFLDDCDAVPHHFFMHFTHVCEILGYKHPVPWIKDWWFACYLKIVKSFHMNPETEAELDARLVDDDSAWRRREGLEQ